MTTMDRRAFLRVSAGTAGLAAIAGPFQGVLAHAAGATGPPPSFGPLQPVPDITGGVTRLALPLAGTCTRR